MQQLWPVLSLSTSLLSRPQALLHAAMENHRNDAFASGAPSLEGIRVVAVDEDPIHVETMTQTQTYQVLFGDESVEMVLRGVNGGPCDFLTKPPGIDGMQKLRHPVKKQSLNAAVNATPAKTYPRSSQDDSSRKRPTEVDHSDVGGFGSRTAKKITAEKHALLHKVANNRSNRTKDNTQKNIRELLENDSVSATMDQVSNHLQNYKTDCQIDQLSTMPTSSPSYSNNSWKNYSASQDSEGSSRFNMRSEGARNFNQIGRPSGSASPVGLGVIGNGSSSTGLGGAAIKGPTSSTSNGNGNGNSSGYGYRYGSGNTNSYCNLNKGDGYGYGYTAGNGGHGGVLTDGIMSTASFTSNLAQPVQQTNETMPTSNLFPSNTVHAMDNPNNIRQQELVPRLYGLSYDCRNGGISMSPWPQDDGTDLLRRYQCENEVMENTATMELTDGIQNAATMNMPQEMQTAAIGETTKEMLGDGPAGQTSAVQPQGLGSDFFNWEGTSFETAGTSGGGLVTDEMLDWLTPDEFENLMNPGWSESMEELVGPNSK